MYSKCIDIYERLKEEFFLKVRHAERIMAGGILVIVGQLIQPSLIEQVQLKERPCLKQSMCMDPEE